MYVRIGLVATALGAIVWLSTGLRAARLETRANEAIGDRSLPATERIRRANDLFERSRQFNPDTRPILLEAGVSLFAPARSGRALKLVRQVVRREPENVRAWYLLELGTERIAPGIAERARARVRELSPSVPEAHGPQRAR